MCWLQQHSKHVLQGGYFEEAQVCRDRELQLKEKIARPGGVTPDNQAVVPLVSVSDVEAVVSAWSGVPVEQMSSDEMKRLRQLQDSLKVCEPALVACVMSKHFTDHVNLQCCWHLRHIG